MIRESKDPHKLKINVYFRPVEIIEVKGTVPIYQSPYLGKDIPPAPFGDHEKIVSFWVENKLMIYPLDMIDHCELYEE